MSKQCVVHRLGLVDYQQAWQLQSRLAEEIAAGARPPTLLLLEHPHTFTFGRRGHRENLLWEPADLVERGVSVHWVDRGGDVTYHGPGQLVGYPLLPLGTASQLIQAASGAVNPAQSGADYVGYIRRLEALLILAISRLGANASRLEGLTGVWAALPGEGRPAKIAAIGVKVDARGVTRHGFALNVNPDMTYWGGIIGCGLADHPVSSLAELMGVPPPMDQVMGAVCTAFGELYAYEMVEAPLLAPPQAPSI